jgi:hypothetical protein
MGVYRTQKNRYGDDYVDSTTQALMRYRQGNFVKLPDDYYDEPRNTEQREYY